MSAGRGRSSLIKAGRGTGAGTGCAGIPTLSAASAFFAPGQQHQFVYNDLSAVALLTGLLVIPAAGLNLSFDIQLGALLDIIANDFCRPREGHQVVPFSAVLPVSLGVFLPVAGCQRQVSHHGAAGRRTNLGILAYIAQKGHFVYASRHSPALL